MPGVTTPQTRSVAKYGLSVGGLALFGMGACFTWPVMVTATMYLDGQCRYGLATLVPVGPASALALAGLFLSIGSVFVRHRTTVSQLINVTASLVVPMVLLAAINGVHFAESLAEPPAVPPVSVWWSALCSLAGFLYLAAELRRYIAAGALIYLPAMFYVLLHVGTALDLSLRTI